MKLDCELIQDLLPFMKRGSAPPPPGGRWKHICLSASTAAA